MLSYYNYSFLTLNFEYAALFSHGNDKYWSCILNTIMIDSFQMMQLHLSYQSVEQKIFSYS